MNGPKRKLESLAIFSLCLNLVASSIVTLSPDGGYHIVIAIKSDIQVIPVSPMQYWQNIKDNMQAFSQALSTASDGTFYVEKVDLLLPWSWTSEIPTNPEGIHFATTHSYETADIRLSENFLTPLVENPNPCGFTGQYMELPLSFFDEEIHPTYGPTYKALLNQWARYRYGVWEEHGDPANAKFPYFYRKPNGTHWLVNGCSDQPIVGDVTDSLGELCSLEDTQAPATDCRLRPQSIANSANSSLMHFHWLESVSHFCDFDTHDPESPNRQNKYCAHRSVWEVLRSSQDYRTVTERLGQVQVPSIKFSMIVTTRRPLLYLLLDEGRTNVPDYVVQQVYGNLTKLFDLDVEEHTVASIGTFPTPIGSNQIVNEKVHWKMIRDYSDEFIEALVSSYLLNRPTSGYGPPIRNFGEAILQVVNDINARDSPTGAILVIVKTGAGENTFGQLTPEAEILTALATNQNILVHAIEMPNTVKKPFDSNLKYLAETTGGRHVIISKSYHIVQDLIPLLNEVNEYLNRPIISPNAGIHLRKIFYKGFVQPGQTIQIPIHSKSLASLQFHLSITKSIQTNSISLTSDKHPEAGILMSQRPDWNELQDFHRRNRYSFYTNSLVEDNSTWTLQYTCNGPISDCRGSLIVYGLVPLWTDFDSETVDISVSTSAGNNVVDMSLYSNPTFVSAPFSIFAKVTKNRQPIRSLSIQATITLIGSSEAWTIDLSDDGSLIDIVLHDGIYSEVFIPDQDGLYRIHVTVQTTTVLVGKEETISLSRLLPVNQNEIGCVGQIECRSIVLGEAFKRVVDLKEPVVFVNTATYLKGTPMRITDLQVIANSNFFITFVFTAPKLIGMDGGADQFSFYLSPRLKTLIGTGEGNREIMINIGDRPGTRITIRIPAMEEVTAYYAVEALHGLERRSGSSNIFGVKTLLVGNDSSVTTTTTTTTTESSQTSIFTSSTANPSTTTIRSSIPTTMHSEPTGYTGREPSDPPTNQPTITITPSAESSNSVTSLTSSKLISLTILCVILM